MRNTLSSIVFDSDMLTSLTRSRYSARWIGVNNTLYALFTKELHSAESSCSSPDLWIKAEESKFRWMLMIIPNLLMEEKVLHSIDERNEKAA